MLTRHLLRGSFASIFFRYSPQCGSSLGIAESC